MYKKLDVVGMVCRNNADSEEEEAGSQRLLAS